MQFLSDLLPNFELHAVCLHCQRMVSVDIQALAQRFGQDCLISDIRHRMRCSHCHRRTSDIRLVYVGNKGKSRAFHYRE